MKIWKYLPLVLILCVFLGGCDSTCERSTFQENFDDTGSEGISYGQILISENPIKAILAVCDGRVYGYRLKSDMEIFEYDLVSKHCQSIGKTRDFVAATMQYAAVDESLFFYLGNGKDCAYLYEIDMPSRSVEMSEKEHSCSPLIYVSAKSNDSLLALVPEIVEDQYVTNLIEVFPGRKKNEKVITHECPLSFSSGSKILAFDFDERNNEIYVLLARADNQYVEKTIERYDSRGNRMQSFSLVSDDADIITNQAIRKFSVDDGLIYIHNFSFESVLLDYSNATSQLLLAGKSDFFLNQSIVQEQNTEGIQVFYQPDQLKLLCVDSATTEIKTIDIHPLVEQKVERLQSVFVDDDVIVFSVISAENEVFFYAYSLELLLNQYAEASFEECEFPILLGE